MWTTLLLLTAHLAWPHLTWPHREDDPERGDVPGWVLVTLMTAGLVIAIWAIAGPALTNVFQTAINRVLSV
ncbi:hypothetical protein MF406_14600 [Georgenia sp. TF02-10]|uniref:hypothetical protein n=1 Tax=Georgenia sp. TF02-10 TaxID=2917725 RepID=UPI001FA6EA85|nr:hypothetical protein [Georgenia sp. TF02-10]UNX54153.1 hypothetical protein MF406_14600 [Georgenia sp. TF02-10]